MKYFVYYAQEGVPQSGLTPTWQCLKDDEGTDVTDAPTITEIGGGWYCFSITYGDDLGPWKNTGDIYRHDLVGVIDGGDELADADRYRPVSITLRGLALARIAHKAIQNKETGRVDIYAVDGTEKELSLDMQDSGDSIIRQPEKAE